MESIGLHEIVLDWSLYPRTQVSDETVSRLMEALRAGRELPAVIVDQDSRRLIDGFHRYHAYKRLDRKEIMVEFRDYQGEAEMYADAGRLNSSHGRPFSTQDCRRFILRAEELGLERECVASILGVTRDRVDVWARETAPFGNEPVPLKRGLLHLTGQPLTSDQVRLNKKWGGMNVRFYINQITDYLEACAYDSTDREFAGAMDRLVALWTKIRGSKAS